MHPIVVQEYVLFETRRRLKEAEQQRLARLARGSHPSGARRAWRAMLTALHGRRGHAATLGVQPAATEARPEASMAGSTAGRQSRDFPAQRQAPDVEEIQRQLALTAGRH